MLFQGSGGKNAARLALLVDPLCRAGLAFMVKLDIFSSEGHYYVEDTDDTGLKEKYADFLAIAEAETSNQFRVVVEARAENSKRLISFYFDSPDSAGKIVYMPDGYVKLTYPDPNLGELINASETRLKDGWYSYFW
jgi:hypothetical protein